MPPKFKKSVSSWQACERCGILLTTKDLQVHLDNSCVIIKEASPLHGFIKDTVLVNCVEEFHVDDGAKYVPHSDRANYIFLSESAMQLCGLVIDGLAVVKYPDGVVVKSVWPMYEKSLTSVMMTKEGLKSLGVKVGVRLSVEPLPIAPLPAAAVIIQPVSLLDAGSFSSPMLSSFSKAFLGKVFLEGNEFCTRYYGQKICFKVSKLVQQRPAGVSSLLPGGKRCEEVMECVSRLCISDQSHIIPYVVDMGTKFQMADAAVDSRRCSNLMSVGGLENTIKKLKEFMDIIWDPSYFNFGDRRGHGCLLYGPPGTGKTMLVKAIASETSATFIEILGSEIYSKYMGEAETRLRSYFAAAKERAPSLIFLDEVDVLCPHGMDGGSGHLQERRITATVLSLLDSLSEEGVVVVAATSRPSALDPRLRRPGRLELELELPVPGPSQRLDILRRIVGAWHGEVTVGDEGFLERVALATHGHVGADLAGVCAHAVSAAVRRSERGSGARIVVGEEDWNEACVQVKPSAMREVLVEVPNVCWSDIGGQHQLKLKLRQAVEWPLKHRESFERLGISPPKGLLMFGPPGCSKTMVAKALATESGLNFISIKGPELFSKWVGESERAVRDVFRRARQVSPSIVFFDELDALGGERGPSRESSGGSSVQERVLAQLLTEMDGISPLSQVTIVAATNRPDRIDKALLRPGRLDQIVYVPLPDVNTRKDILTRQFSNVKFAADVVLDDIVEQTEGYSGAEVVAVCQEAGLSALEEDIHSLCINRHHVDKALKIVKPRTPQYLLDLYENYAIKSL